MATISIGGTNLGSTYGLYLRTDTIPGLASVRQAKVNVSSRHGSWEFPPEYEPKVFELPCYVTESSLSNLTGKLDDIFDVIDVLGGEQTLQFDSIYTDRYWNVQLTSCSSVAITGYTGLFTLKFTAFRPFAWSNNLYTHTVSGLASDDEVFDPPTISGNIWTPPTITLTANSQNPSNPNDDTIKVGNIESDVDLELQWSGTWGSGDTFTIDVDNYMFYHTPSGGSQSSAMGGITQSQFPYLRGDGLSDTWRVRGWSGNDIKFEYRYRWL